MACALDDSYCVSSVDGHLRLSDKGDPVAPSARLGGWHLHIHSHNQHPNPITPVGTSLLLAFH